VVKVTYQALRPAELLGREQHLLRLGAAEKTELSLGRAKLVVGL
jgi:hypothetical protein